MIKSKTVYLVLFLIFLLIIVIIVQINQDPIFWVQQPVTNSNGQVKETPKKPNQFKILSTSLSDKPLGITEPIIIRFDKNASPFSVIYEINPTEEIKISPSFDPKEIIIEPTGAWNFDTSYQLKILKTTRSLDYSELDKEYNYTFKTVPYSGI